MRGGTWQVLRKDLRLGPRSPLLLWAILLPVVLTLLVQGVFGELLAPRPSLAIVDGDGGAVAFAALGLEGIDLEIALDETEVRGRVAEGRLTGAVLVPRGFLDAVAAGERPPVPLVVSGESLPGERALLTGVVVDLVRVAAGVDAPVDVEVVTVGEPGLPIALRLVPLLVLYAVAIPGGMVPAASLVEEKERGTLVAMLVTPTSVRQVLLAKGLLGVLLGALAGVVTLTMNGVWGAAPLVIVTAVVIGAVMMAEVGLVLGAWARDTNALFAAWKGGGIVLFLPAVFFVWPGLPSWPGRFMPAWYFLHPTFRVATEGATFPEVAGELAIGAAICAALLPVVAASARGLERRVAGAAPAAAPADDVDAMAG